MKKIIILIGVFLLLVTKFVYSQTVDIDLAKKVSKNFYKAKYKSGILVKGSKSDVLKNDKIKIKNTFEKTHKGHNSYYITNIKNGGWVIVSAHKAMGPILAHSLSGNLDPNDLPPVFWDWMEQYEILIDSAFQKKWINKDKEKKWKDFEEDNISNSTNFKRAIAFTPFFLLTTEWGQSWTNDFQCPDNGAYNAWMKSNTSCNCDRCTAGCVAVAMAQIMNYWGYATGDYADFNWWDMPDELIFSDNPNYDTEKEAVSYLLKRCGDRMDMEYCSSGCKSSADPSPLADDAIGAFGDFGYKESDMNYERKFWHTYNGWVNQLKDELNSGRPVLYRYKGSHSFVCDGHDGDNTFHFNLGWNGDCNGFYDFEDLKSSNCTGDCNNNFDFTDILNNHHCIVGIKPNAKSTLTLENKTISTSSSAPWQTRKTYQAKNGITAAGNNTYFIVDNNADCHLIAGDYIYLRPGFSAREGSSLQVRAYKKPSLKSTSTKYNYDNVKDIVLSSENNNDNTENLALSNEAIIDKNEAITVYPNPTDGILYISSNLYGENDISIEIFDLMGKKVYQNNFKNINNIEINIEDIPNGIYFVKIYLEKECFINRIIKQ